VVYADFETTERAIIAAVCAHIYLAASVGHEIFMSGQRIRRVAANGQRSP
jgi:hypothetical protein